MKINLVGQAAPKFKLETDTGEFFDSASLDGTWRVVFFYSRHNSPTCKRGCLTFKQQHDLFQSAGCSIVGIGPGTVEEQASFKLELGDLPFPLLADPERIVGTMYNVPMHLGQFPAKSSFLIGPDNTIRYVYDWLFRPRRHVAKILGDISKVSGGD